MKGLSWPQCEERFHHVWKDGGVRNMLPQSHEDNLLLLLKPSCSLSLHEAESVCLCRSPRPLKSPA